MNPIVNLHAAVASMTQHNKKLYGVTLRDGQSLLLAVEDMFTVQLMQRRRVMLQVRFQPLSSLNNLEMSPMYRVTDVIMDEGINPLLGDALLTCVFAVYQYYTQGSIHPWRPGVN